MTAKEMFETLGYIQEIYDNKEKPTLSGIQYIKRDDDSEMKRVGMLCTKTIEFYHKPKTEIFMCMDYEHKNGTKSEGNSTALSLDEFYAVQKQVEELKEQNIWK